MRRRPLGAVLLGVIATLAAGTLTVLTGQTAFAHGAVTTPGSRTYLCYTDGHWTGGDLDPRNEACKAAVAQGGKQPLWDWYGVLRSDGGGRMQGFIPDGQLCSGGNTKYAGFDLARADWPATHLTSGGRYTVHYNAWATHPGQFRLFVTKDGYDPTKPLTWNDLESAPFSTWNETTPDGTGEYYWDVTWPSGKTGRHLIYSVWARTDSQETFYGCSDVIFDGGNGQVTGIPTGTSTSTTGAAATTSSGTATTTTTTTTAATGTGTTGAGTTSAGAGADAGSCQASVVVSGWSGGYQGTVTVVNNGAAANPWKVTFTVPSGVSLVNGWNATVTQSGTTITAAAPSYNQSLGTGSQVQIGFTANGPSSPGPTNVTLNGAACGGSSATGTPTTSSTPSTSSTPTTGVTPTTSASPTTGVTPTTSPSTSSGTGTGALNDGFETQTGSAPSGLWKAQAVDCSGTGSVTIDRTVAHSGTASLRVDGAAGYCNHAFAALTTDLSTLGRTIYTRVYVRHTTPLPADHVAFAAFTDTADGGKDLRIGGQNKALQWNRQSDDATLPAQSPAGVALSTALPTGSWQCLEVAVNGSTGTADTWLNGTLVPGLHADGVPTADVDQQWYSKTWRPSLTALKLGWESYAGGADTLWFDDVAVGSSRIGC